LSSHAFPLEQALPYSADAGHWFARVRDLGAPVWLDSARPFSDRGRYDIVSAAPLQLLAGADSADPFATVRAAIERSFADHQPIGDWPFSGGAIGLFGYELGRRLQRLPARAGAPLFPDLQIGIYSWAVVTDHQARRTALLVRPETPTVLRTELLLRLRGDFTQPGASFDVISDWSDEFPAESYTAAFDRLQRYIHAGDCYQVNLARRCSASFEGDPWEAYKRLRSVAAAPFSAYLESDHGAILCLSPERFLAAQDGRLLTQPIKGTAPRNTDPILDERQAQALLASDKNRAENLMIVDLLRNDLGRSCVPGSIHVSRLFELQSFATVHHLVSSVHGELRPDRHPLDALRDCFPGGSITGAPKIRAMQIIDELEPRDRAVFCGALGYIGVDGRMDTNLTIRTLLASDGRLHAWAGGGIVADSTSAAELAETRNKIEPLLKALGERAALSQG
jgi:para-aminobenzoate synthetase component I